MVKLKTGQAYFQNALHSHAFENVGKKPIRLLIKVVGRLSETGGYRLQFGWMPQ